MNGLSLLRVQEGLADVEGSGGGGGQGSGQSAGHNVGGRVVLSVGVEELLEVLVCHEVERLEGHVHGQLGGVAAVESRRAFLPQHGAHAVEHAAVRRVEHLHSLFHNCGEEKEDISGEKHQEHISDDETVKKNWEEKQEHETGSENLRLKNLKLVSNTTCFRYYVPQNSLEVCVSVISALSTQPSL